MNLLALETATESCSVALRAGKNNFQKKVVAAQKHTTLLLPMIGELLSEAGLRRSDLDAVAFGQGPGSFTGVRLATSIAQGIGLALDVPLIPVSTLATLAQGQKHEKVYAALDARRNQIYCALYARDHGNRMTLQGSEQVIDPGHAPLPPSSGWFGTGTGWKTYPRELAEKLSPYLLDIVPHSFPEAVAMLELACGLAEKGHFVRPELATPVYLRERIIES